MDAHLTRYQRWLGDRHGLAFDSYDALWQWSVDELEAFWASVWAYFELQSPTPWTRVLQPAADGRAMPGARWFEGAQVNYTRQVLRHVARAHAAGHPALVWAAEAMAERDELAELTWPELERQVGTLARHLRALGVGPGDRVCAVLPNAPQTVVAFLATIGLGAIWSVCSPDMGPVAILDRFGQIEPRVLIAVDGYRFGGVLHDRRGLLGEVLAGLPSVTHLVRWSRLGGEVADARARPALDWDALLGTPPAGDAAAPFDWPWLPFDHPLWVVYSSGTTGLPKPIVHGHGGVILESLKGGALHNDVGASADTGDRVCWNSSTTWIVWNGHIASLLSGTTLCLYEGNASGRMVDAEGQRVAPDWTTLWRFVAASRATHFGAGSAFFAACQKAGIALGDDLTRLRGSDLSRLRAVAATGSPLAHETFEWLWASLPRPGGRPMWLNVISGGTDVACAFVGGVPTLPMVAGEMQARCLGIAVESWSEVDAQGRGQPLMDEVGELVVTRPMPSMPLYFWNDAPRPAAAAGAAVPDVLADQGVGPRYLDSYFDMYPGIWRHGDWLRLVPHPEAGAAAAIIYGRSDATINRHGIRMGTAELYRAVDAMPEVLDSLVVDLEYLGRPSWMPLFVVLREGLALDAALTARLKDVVRRALSPRHVPDEVFQVAAIPRTLSGKKMELPVKKLLMGAAPETVLKRDAMANAEAIDAFVALARRRAAAG